MTPAEPGALDAQSVAASPPVTGDCFRVFCHVEDAQVLADVCSQLRGVARIEVVPSPWARPAGQLVVPAR